MTITNLAVIESDEGLVMRNREVNRVLQAAHVHICSNVAGHSGTRDFFYWYFFKGGGGDF